MKKIKKSVKDEIKNLFSERERIFSWLEERRELLKEVIEKIETIKEEILFIPTYSTYVKVENLKNYGEYRGTTIPHFLSEKIYYWIFISDEVKEPTELELFVAHELFGHVELCIEKKIDEKIHPLYEQLFGREEKIIKIAKKDEGKELLREYYYYRIILNGLEEAYAYVIQTLMGLYISLKEGRSVKNVAEELIKVVAHYSHRKETYEEIMKKGVEKIIKMLIEKGVVETSWLVVDLGTMTGILFLFEIDRGKGGYLSNFLINYAENKQFSSSEIKELILKLWEYKKEIEKRIDEYLEFFITYLKSLNSLINKILE
jgi:hypothetical protein